MIEDMLPPPSQATLIPIGSRDYLDPNAKVWGKLEFAGPARIDGFVDGEIDAQDSLAIGRSAAVTAKIKAVWIIVAGTVSGELCATERIELYPSAKVSGDLSAPKLVMHEGAVFKGHCAIRRVEREDSK